MTADTLSAVAQAVGRAVIDRLFDRCILDPKTGCLLWTGYVNEGGYGQLRCGGHVVLVHRLMFELTNWQKLSPDDVVMHVCDTPACCEPMHLQLGSHLANVADRVAKNRSARGERNGRSKLATVDAVAIRSRCDEPVSKLAREFGVDPRAIRAVLAGETWRTA